MYLDDIIKSNSLVAIIDLKFKGHLFVTSTDIRLMYGLTIYVEFIQQFCKLPDAFVAGSSQPFTSIYQTVIILI